MPEALRIAYATATLSSLGHLLIQASVIREAARVTRRAAAATDDMSAADALISAAAALDGAGYTVQGAMHVVRSVTEDMHKIAPVRRTE